MNLLHWFRRSALVVRSAIMCFCLTAATPVDQDLRGGSEQTDTAPVRSLPPLIEEGDKEQPASPEIDGERSAQWEQLDHARTLFLNGDTSAAREILLELDSTLTTKELVAAKQELYAYILSSLGEHEAAFDSLQAAFLFRIGSMEAEKQEALLHSETTIDGLTNELEQQGIAAAKANEEYKEERVLLILIASVIGILLLSMLIWSLSRRPSRSTKKIPEDPSFTEVEKPVVKEVRVRKETPISVNKGSPGIDVALIHAHLKNLSDLLSKNENLQAAVQLDTLTRFIRGMAERDPKGALPIEKAIAILRHFFKLASLRSTKKLNYSVDAVREISGTELMVPCDAIVDRSEQALDVTLRTEIPSISVEIRYASDKANAQCVIRYFAGAGVIDETKGHVQENDLMISPISYGDGYSGWVIEWPAGVRSEVE